MKTIEEKARAYDEAINRMKHYVVDEYGCSRIQVADVFPELKESEDERIKEKIKMAVEQTVWLDSDKNECISWLGKQGEQKPAEWSEEDEKFFKTALWHISYSISNGKSTDFHSATTDWLKSLKDRYTWKPSNEQLDALRYVYQHYTPAVSEQKAWDSLKNIEIMYGQLKKLKED